MFLPYVAGSGVIQRVNMDTGRIYPDIGHGVNVIVNVVFS